MTRKSAHWAWLVASLAAVTLFSLLAAPKATSEQASSDTRRAQAGYIDAGDEHTCAILADRSVRCWGKGLAGRLGYGNESNVLTAGASGPVNVGAGRSARAIVAGDFHTCAILDDGSVRCWGFGANGRLGYASSANVLSPAQAPAVDLGPGRTATAITAGASHTCAILDDGTVRCWGNGVSGRLGYGNQQSIGDDEPPASAGPVNIGAGRTAVAISAGDFHTCVVRDDAQILCWGFGSAGQLGYGGTSDIGDDETPGSAGPVNLGGRTVRAVSGGKGHTCVILDDRSVRCWGFGADGRLGYGGTGTIPAAVSAPPVNLGPGRTAAAIAAGEAHTCAILDTGAVRCWGFGGNGRLGGGNTSAIGDDPGETPASVPPVDLGERTARALSVGFSHSCAGLDDGSVRCWGFGGSGRLGYGNETSVGDSAERSVLLAGSLQLGGTVAPAVADLRLAISAATGQLPVGAATTLSVSVGNSGPDATGGVAVSLPAPAGLRYSPGAAQQGSFSPSSGVWTIGTLAPGALLTLTLPTTAAAPGTQVVSAEVAASSVLDPTSTPGNGVPEDDRADVTLIVPAVAAPPATSAKTRVRARGLRVRVVRYPRRGKVKRLKVAGILYLPKRSPALRCAGRVRARAKIGRRTVAVKAGKLRMRKKACRYTVNLKPKRTGSARRVKVTAKYLGNAQVRPRTSRALKVRIR